MTSIKKNLKKKKGFLKYFFFLSLFIIIFISILYYTNENLRLFDRSYIVRDSSEHNENVVLKIDKLESRIDKNELQISNAADNLNIAQKSIEEVRSKSQDNSDKIIALSKDNETENITDFENTNTSIKEQDKYFIRYILFRTLIKINMLFYALN